MIDISLKFISKLLKFNNLTLIILIITGCQTNSAVENQIRSIQQQPQTGISEIFNTFDGPAGAILQDFVNASLYCKNETTNSGDIYQQNNIVTCNAVMACLAKKAYYPKPYGKFDPSYSGVALKCYRE